MPISGTIRVNSRNNISTNNNNSSNSSNSRNNSKSRNSRNNCNSRNNTSKITAAATRKTTETEITAAAAVTNKPVCFS